MPDLTFEIVEAGAAADGMTPLLQFELEITNAPPEETVQSVMLQVQVRFEATQRSYTEEEKARLVELFGAPEDWGRTLHSRRWTQVSVAVPTFSERTRVTLPVPCTYDLNIASAKYFYALEEGAVPLLFLFSGTVFYRSADARTQVQPISWNAECAYRMPVTEWKAMMETHYPGSAWLYLDREVFERLLAYKRRQGHTSWERAIEHLLAQVATSASNGQQQEVAP